MSSRSARGVDFGDPVKDTTITALASVLEPLLELMFDAGVTVPELNKVARDRAVRAATKRVMKESGRESKSRVAIITGLPRSEVTQILKSETQNRAPKRNQHRARRVLAEWHQSSAFLAPNGQPATLPIFGKSRSFQNLVERHGGGIPVRAMLDELIRLRAVEQIEGQKVRATVRVPVQKGMTNRSIKIFGERGRDLLETLTHNVRSGSPPIFEATALITDIDVNTLLLARQEISEQGKKFIQNANSLLRRSRRKVSQKDPSTSETCRLGVTVCCFQDRIINGPSASLGTPRKNLRRRQLGKSKVGAS